MLYRGEGHRADGVLFLLVPCCTGVRVTEPTVSIYKNLSGRCISCCPNTCSNNGISAVRTKTTYSITIIISIIVIIIFIVIIIIVIIIVIIIIINFSISRYSTSDV